MTDREKLERLKMALEIIARTSTLTAIEAKDIAKTALKGIE